MGKLLFFIQVVIVFASFSVEASEQTLYSVTLPELKQQIPACDSNKKIEAYDKSCRVAIHRYCIKVAGKSSGFGPVNFEGGRYKVVCSNEFQPVSTTWQQVNHFLGGCSPKDSNNLRCQVSISRFCKNNGTTNNSSTYLSGFGPIEFTSSALHIACVKAQKATLLEAENSDLKGYQDSCSDPRSSGLDCAKAFHKFCRASGFKSGSGPAESDGKTSQMFCVQRESIDPRISLVHAHGAYPDLGKYNDTFLNYGASVVQFIGFQSMEVLLNSKDACPQGKSEDYLRVRPDGYYRNREDCEQNYQNMTEMAQRAGFQGILNRQLNTLFISSETGNPATITSHFIAGRLDAAGNVRPIAKFELDRLYLEHYQLADYLLTRPDNKIKKIILQSTNEMDWQLLASHNGVQPLGKRRCLAVQPQAIKNAVLYWNTIQTATDAAKKANIGTSKHNGLKLYHACEVNLVAKSYQQRGSVLSASEDVIPQTACDLYGYSAYDTALGVAESCSQSVPYPSFQEAVKYLKEQISKGSYYGDYSGERLYISEFGIPENAVSFKDPVKRVNLINEVLRVALEKEKLSYFNYWQLYDGDCDPQSIKVPYQVDYAKCSGFAVMRPDGSLTDAFLKGLSQRRGQ
ncbi:MAG: hypothetical protein KDD38_00965 [Bdellovibrionales bacterium]|nr:hypothetical protein [Bdellovibrionales bacterium]